MSLNFFDPEGRVNALMQAMIECERALRVVQTADPLYFTHTTTAQKALLAVESQAVALVQDVGANAARQQAVGDRMAVMSSIADYPAFTAQVSGLQGGGTQWTDFLMDQMAAANASGAILTEAALTSDTASVRSVQFDRWPAAVAAAIRGSTQLSGFLAALNALPK